MKNVILLIVLFATFKGSAIIISVQSGSNPACPGTTIVLTTDLGTAVHWYTSNPGYPVSISDVAYSPTYTFTTNSDKTIWATQLLGYSISANITIQSYYSNISSITPGPPQGQTNLCVGSTSTNYTRGLRGSSTNWLLTPSNAGVITNNNSSVDIAWSSSFSGLAQLTYRVNSCGSSSYWSSPLSISLSNPASFSFSPSCAVPIGSSINLSSSLTNPQWSTGDTTNQISQNNSGVITATGPTCGTNLTTHNLGVFVSSFNDSIATPNGPVYSVFRNGNTSYYGGDFNYVGAVSGNGILLNNSNNYFDHGMPRINGTVLTVIQDGSGGWYLGGSFTKVGIYARQNIAHINADKTVDQQFNPTANDIVETLYLSGNNLYAGGKFTHIGDVNRNYIVALNKTTGMATSWDLAANGRVRSIALYNANLYVGGDFTSIGGNTRNYLACVDTIYAQSTSWNPAPNALVNKLYVSGVRLFVAGDFSTIGGLTRAKLCSYTMTLGLLDAWNPTPNAKVYDMFVNNNLVYVAGAFTNIGTQNRNYIAALSTTANTGLATSWNANANDTVFALGISGSNLIAGGRFTNIGGSSLNRIASINITTGIANTWNPNINGLKLYTPMVKCLAINNNAIYAGGQFYSAGGSLRNNVAAIDASNGTLLAWDANANGIVRSVYALGNYVYIGGDFTQLGGWITKNHIAQLNAINAAPTGWNPNANGNVHAITSKGANLYVGGEFTTIGGNTRPKLAIIYITDGTSPVWSPNPNNIVRALSISGDTLYTGGDFTTIGGQTRNRVASYNITSQVITNFNPNANNSVYAIAVKSNKAFISGAFTTLNALTRNNLGVYNVLSNSVTSETFNFSGLNTIYSLSGADSAIYIGGKYNSTSLPSNVVSNNSNAVKVNSSQVSEYWHPMPDDIVRSIFVYKDKVYLGGNFLHIIGTYQPYFAVVDNYFMGTASIIAPVISKFCEGDNVAINALAVNGYTYQWYKNNVLINGATATSYYPVSTGNYTCQMTDTINYGNMFSNAVHVDVDPLADTTLTSSGPTIFCGGGSVTLYTATGTNYAYQWYKDGSAILSGGNSSSYIATLAGSYYCDVYNASGCARSSQNKVVNTSGLSPVIANNTGLNAICQGQSITLSSPYSSGNLWYKDAISTGITTQNYIATTAGVYKCFVTAGSCSGFSQDITLTVTPSSTATNTAAGSTTFCQGGNVVLNANTGSGLTYQWTLDGNNIGGATAASYSANASGNYAVVVTNAATCKATSAATTVIVNALPTATNTAAGATTFCQGSNVVLNANTGNGLNYQWTLNGSNIGGATTSSYTANASGNYAVIVTNASTCKATSTIQTIIVNALPVVTLGNITSPICVDHTAMGLTGTPAGGNYSGTGVSGSNFDPAVSGSGIFNIFYTYIDGNNCSANTSQSVVVDFCSGITESANGLVSIYPNPANDLINVVLDASLINNTSIEIYDGIGKLVVSEKIFNKKTSYNINSFENGIYIVRILSNKKYILKRIIKN